MKKITFILVVLSLVIPVKSQDTTSGKIAILPFISNGIDPASVQTAESIFRMDLGKVSSLDVISERKVLAAIEDNECADKECAIEIGKKLSADEVLLCKLNPLGENIIVQYILIQMATGKNILAEQATALSLEDLDAVMQRVALSVAKHTPFSANVEVGNVVAQETVEPSSRASRFNFGLGFGYLFPTEGYDNDDKSFTVNLYFDYEIKDVAVGLMLGARDGVAVALYGNYLFSKTDICPYLGAGLGFHWVDHDYSTPYDYNYNYYPSPNTEYDEDGIELGLGAGFRFLHTYNIQFFINVEYIITFNDFNDKSIVFTIGIL
jgi:TolB-like protein